MVDRPLVSIITPTLNQARFLERMLVSLRGQTYPSFEHVVIDGGSTDGTLDVLRREADAGHLVWVSEDDAGMYDAINKGLARASGEILCYLNSDDAWLPWALETVVGAFAARPDADIVFGDGIKVREDTGQQRLRLFGPFDRISLANYESLMQPAVFWRRRLFERMGGFDPGMRYVADLDYWLRASAAGATIVHVPEVLAIERIHPARLSSAHEAPMAAENERMRAGHAGDLGGPSGRARAVARDERWQRWLWLRFLAAFAIRPFGRPWRRFLRAGEVRVDGERVLHGIRAYHHQELWGAASSGLASVLLTDRPVVQGPGMGDRLLQRLRVLALVLPRLPQARLAVSRGRGLGRRVRRIGAAVRRPFAPVIRPIDHVLGPVRSYRREIRKPRPPVPMVSWRALVRDFLPWWRSQGRSTLQSRRPWITFQATRILQRRLSRNARVLEYGSGGSTLWLASRTAQLVSVEHDPAWYEEVRAVVGSLPSVELVLIEPRTPLNDEEAAVASASADFLGQTFADYVNVADRFPDHHFDLLIVDGRARPSAFFRAEPKVRVGGLVVLDDSERPRYRAAVDAAKAAGWIARGRYGPKPFTPWFARTTVWEKTRDL